MSGLRITDAERAELGSVVERCIVSHIEGFTELKKKAEKEAQDHRLQMFDETARFCEDMKMRSAQSKVFREFTLDEIIADYDYWKSTITKDERKQVIYVCPSCGSIVSTTKPAKSVVCHECETLMEKDTN